MAYIIPPGVPKEDGFHANPRMVSPVAERSSFWSTTGYVASATQPKSPAVPEPTLLTRPSLSCHTVSEDSVLI